MRTVSSLAFAVAAASVLLSPAPASAQGAAAPALHPSQPSTIQQPSATVLMQAPVPQNCPVGLFARHGNQGATVKVSPGEKHPEQSYRISFQPRDARTIVEARITLHGLAGHEVIPAGTAPSAKATESFTLAPAATANHRFQSTVYLGRLTGVQWVELNELTYGDGTRWHQSATARCRVAPNGFMLVGAEH